MTHGSRCSRPTDMVIHAATHLFHDGALEHGLRDLVDIHGLLNGFASTSGFWESLIPRARELQLARPLFYALRYCERLLGTEIPCDVLRASRRGAPPLPILWTMDRLVRAVLSPQRPDKSSLFSGFARWILYLRSHYMRMPLKLLVPHLLRKASRRRAAHRQAALP